MKANVLKNLTRPIKQFYNEVLEEHLYIVEGREEMRKQFPTFDNLPPFTRVLLKGGGAVVMLGSRSLER